MPLTFTPPPTAAQTQAALADLPDGFAGMGETILAAPGVTADTLLIVADALAAGAAERRALFPGGDAETRAMERLAAILRDAAPRYPHPPRLPASAPEAGGKFRARRTWGAPTITQDEGGA
ncbi:MAG: hypothetical protein ACK4ST_02530 [Elioraea tepidiphila]